MEVDVQIIKGFKLRKSNVGSVCGEGGRRALYQGTFLKSQRTFRLGAQLPSLQLQQILAVNDDVLETPREVGRVQRLGRPWLVAGQVVFGPPEYCAGASQALSLLSQSVYLDQEDFPPPRKSSPIRSEISPQSLHLSWPVCQRGKFCSDTAVQL